MPGTGPYICDNCGARFHEAPHFCRYCGQELASRVDPNYREAVDRHRKTSRAKLIIVITLASLAFLLISAGPFFIGLIFFVSSGPAVPSAQIVVSQQSSGSNSSNIASTAVFPDPSINEKALVECHLATARSLKAEAETYRKGEEIKIIMTVKNHSGVEATIDSLLLDVSDGDNKIIYRDSSINIREKDLAPGEEIVLPETFTITESEGIVSVYFTVCILAGDQARIETSNKVKIFIIP